MWGQTLGHAWGQTLCGILTWGQTLCGILTWGQALGAFTSPRGQALGALQA